MPSASGRRGRGPGADRDADRTAGPTGTPARPERRPDREGGTPDPHPRGRQVRTRSPRPDPQSAFGPAVPSGPALRPAAGVPSLPAPRYPRAAPRGTGAMDKTFDAASAEPRLTQAWESAGAFRAGAGARRAETFCVMIPPPNVTGSLHIGHAFNNTLQDVLVRWHRMRGFDTLWQPGQDHAGIATQMVVERELAKTNRRRTDMSREEFEALVWEQKERSGGTIIEQLKRLGASCDWSRNDFTMDPHYQEAVLKVFVDLYDKGIVYRGKRLVNWDPHFETAISDLEVENVETPGHMWHFRYPLADGETYEYVERDEDGRETLRETRDHIAIATTRPETMLGDGAVAVHPSDERYAPIVGKLCEIPVGPREHRRLIPIITDEHPDPTFGSGAVKITGAHDFNDHGVATRNGIPLYRLMDARAAMRTDGLPYEEAAGIAGEIARGEREAGDVEAVNLVPEDLRGLDRLEARARVVAQITAEGLAVMVPATDPRLGAPGKGSPSRKGEAPDRARSAAEVAPGAPALEAGPSRGGEEAPDRVRGAEGTGGAGGTSAAAGSGGPGAPAPEPGPRSPDAEAPGRGAAGTSAPVEPEEGGEARGDALVPLVEPKLIVQPMGDRSKVVIEPMLTDQWFVDTDRIVGPAIASVREGMARPEGSVEGTRILPEQDAKVYFNWLEAIEPWCISRQLWWGHRIPVWWGPNVESIDLSEMELLKEYGPLPDEPFCAATQEEAFEKAKTKYSERYPDSDIVIKTAEFGDERTDRALAGVLPGPRKLAVKAVRSSTFFSNKTPTSSTPGSPPRSGPSPRWAGPRTRPSIAATSPPTCSSRASTSSSSGSPG